MTHTTQGTTRWVSRPFHVTFEVELFPDGRRVHQIGYENNFYFAESNEFGPAPFQAVFSHDKNLNNKFDRRITRSLETDGGLLWIEEVDPTEKGLWVESQRWGTAQWADQAGSGGDKCNGTANIEDESVFLAKNVPGVKILTSGASACDLKRSSKLGAAMNCVRKRLDCIDRMNPTLRNNVDSHLSTDGWAIGCNNLCPDRDASTVARIGDIPAKTNFNGNTIDTVTSDELCSLLMHESMHMAETAYNPKDHDQKGKI